MIMTKEKARDLSKIAAEGLPGIDTLPPEGSYVVTSTCDAEAIRILSANSDVDYVVMGMIVPAQKAASFSELFQDEDGFLPSPVVLLKKDGKRDSARPSFALPENRFIAPVTESEDSGPNISIKEIEIIPGRHEVKVNGKPVILTFSEFRILQTLASKPGWVFSRDRIIHAIHGDGYNCTERAVDVQVTGLRKKLGDAGRHIETVRGVGYRFGE